MARSSESTDYSSEMYGSLLIYRNDGEKGPIYDLSEGTTTIGASTDADIRLKIKDNRLEDIHCLLQVNTNGIAVIFNKSIAAPVTINGDPLVYSKNRVLKHEDYFEVLGKKFQYFNDNISEKDYQRSLTAIRKSVAPVLQTKTISTKIPVHQRVLIANERDKITDYVTPEKCPNRRSGTDGSKTTSKLVVSKALSKLPKSSRRLSLNLTPRVLSSRRMSLPKKKCGGCADLIDFSSPRKSILKRNSKKMSEINDLPDENYLTSEDETPGSGLRSSRSVGRSSVSNIPADSNNSKEKTPRNISTSSRSIERSSPNERTLSVDLEEITPESSKRFSRSMDRSSTNRTSKVAYTNELLHLDATTPETSGRYSRNIDSSSAKKTKALDENTPETSRRLTRKTHSVSNMNDMTLPLDESTPAHSQRYSRNNVSSSAKRTASTIDDTLEENDSTLPLDEKSPKADMSPLRVEERFSEKTKTVDIHETKIQGNSRRSSRSLVRSSGANRRSSVSNLPDKNEVTSGTSHIFSKNIESSPAKRRASSIGYLQKESVFSLKEKTPDIKSRSSGNSSSSSDTGKTFSKNIDGFLYKKRTSSVSNLPEKNNLTPGTNHRHSINITSSPAERNNISIGDDQTSDFEAETKRRYSINLQNSSGRTASSLGNHLDEEKTPETNYRSLRNTGSSSAKRTATSIGNLTEEETPETSKGLSVKINGSSSKRISSIDNETDSSRCLDSKLKNTQKLFENNAHNVKRKIYSVGNIHHDTLNLRYSLKEKTKSMMEFGYHSDTQDAPRRSVRKSSKLDGSYEVSVFSGLMETDSQILNSEEDHTENINKLNLRFSLGGHTTKSSVNSRISSRSKAHSLGGLMVEGNYQRKNKSTAAIRSSDRRNTRSVYNSEDYLSIESGIPAQSRTSRSLARNAYSHEDVEDDLENEVFESPVDKRKSSLRRVSSMSSTSGISEIDIDSEPDQSTQSTNIKSSAGRSSRRNTYSVLDYTDNQRNKMIESPVEILNRKSTSSSRNCSFIEISEDDLENSNTDQESYRRTSFRRSSRRNASSVEESEGDFENEDEPPESMNRKSSISGTPSLIEISEDDLDNGSVHESRRRSWNRRSSSRRNTSSGVSENRADKKGQSRVMSVNRKSSLGRNSSVLEISEDDLESSNTDQESNRRTSVRSYRSNRRHSSLMKKSEGDLEIADEPTLIRKSSVDRSSSRRYRSTSEHSEGHANEKDQSPLKAANRRSFVRSSLKNESLIEKRSIQDLENEMNESPAGTMNRKSRSSRRNSSGDNLDNSDTDQESNRRISVRYSSLNKESEVDFKNVQEFLRGSSGGRSLRSRYSTEHSENQDEKEQSTLKAVNRKSVSRSSLKTESLVDRHSVQDYQKNLGTEINESSSGTIDRKSASSSRNSSLIEMSEDDLDSSNTDQESNRRNSVRTSLRKTYYLMIESEGDLDNADDSTVQVFIRNSSVGRSSSRRNISISEHSEDLANRKAQSPVKTVNRISVVKSPLKNESPAEAMNRKLSLSRNSSENSTIQESNKITSVRRSSRRDLSLMKESEVDLEHEDEPTVQALTKKSPVDRSSIGKNTFSTEYSEDRTNERDQSPLKAANRKSVARSSLKNKSLVDAYSIQDPQENLGNEMDESPVGTVNRKSSLSRNISLNEKSEDDLDNCTDQESSRRTSVRSSGRNSSLVNESGDNLENEIKSAVTEFIRRSSVDKSVNTKYQSPVKAVNRKSAVRSSLKNESPAEAMNRKSSLSRHSSLVDVSENSTLDQDHTKRTSFRRSSSRDSSLMKESEVNLENENKPTVQSFTRRSSVGRSSMGRNTSSTDHYEDRTNEILKTDSRKSVARSSLENKYVVDAHSIQDPQENLGNEIDESPVGTVNKKSSSLHSNSSLNEKSEDDLDNSMNQETSRRTSVRASKRNSSLVKESGDNFENEVEPTVEEFIRRSSGGRSRNTSSTEHSEDHGREEGRSPSKSVERKSVGRSSLKNESLPERSEAELANVSNRSTQSRTSRSSSRIRDSSFEEVDLATPKSSAKKQRSNVLPYAPKTEVITPTTPDGIKSDDAGFKTPLNTPGLFNEIKKSMLKSRSKLQKSSSNLLEEFNKDTGLKRPRESVGDSGRSTKKMRLIINEDDTFEESHTFESDASLEESYDNIVENDTYNNFHSDDETLEKSRLKSPKSDLREVKNKSASHKLARSPKNDLRNIVGVKKLFATPRNAKSPRNDLTNVPNLRKIMSPKSQNSPANDLTDVRGLKRLMKTPKVTKAPLNDLSDINMEGVSKMFHVSGVHRLSTSSDIENNEDLFDRLFDKRPARTYRGTSASPRGKSMDAYGGDRRKTMGDRGDSKSSPRVLDWVEEQKVIRMDRARKMSESEEKNPTKVEEKSETPISHPTRSRRNVSAELASKESETGIVDSPLALTRGRRNVKKVKVSPPPKVTRSRRKAKEAPIISEEKLQLSELDETDTSIVASEKNATFDEIQQPNMEANKKAPKRQNTRAQTKVVETSEDVTFSDISTASVGEEPKKRGRRAANKKDVLEETPKQTTRGAKKVKAIEKAEKPPAESSRTRQRTAKVAHTEDIEQEPEEKKPAEVVEISVETFSDNSTAGSGEGPKNRGRIVATKKEVQDETPKKVTRGAKKVKAIEEADKPPPPESPRTRKRTAKVAQSEEIDQVPEEKKPVRRGRNAKAILTDNDEENDKKQEDEIVKKVSQRKGKGAKIDIEIKAELEEETIVKRRGRLAAVAQNEGKPEDLDTKDSKGEEEVGPRRPKRGRKASVDEIPKEKIEEVPPPKRGRRGKATPVETATEVQIQSEMKQETEADKEKEPIVEKPAKGRGRTIKVVENKDAKEEENVEVSGKEEDKAVPKRGRRVRKASVDDMVKEKVEEVVPTRRGKRGKAAMSVEVEKELVSLEPEVQTEVEKSQRGRSRSKKAVVEEENIDTVSPVKKRPQRNNKSKEIEQEPEVVAKKTTRSKGNVAEKMGKNEMDESLTSKQTRAVRANKKNLDISAEEATGRRKKHVQFKI